MGNSTTQSSIRDKNIKIKVERLTKFNGLDLHDLCDAAIATYKDTFAFTLGSLTGTDSPRKEQLERYFEGVLLVPERELFVGRVDGTIAGSIQLVKPTKSNKSSDFAVWLDSHFVAPWARGHGLARTLMLEAEKFAKKKKFSLIKLSVRATRDIAIHLYEKSGYTKWGELEKYERMGDEIVPGYFFSKDL